LTVKEFAYSGFYRPRQRGERPPNESAPPVEELHNVMAASMVSPSGKFRVIGCFRPASTSCQTRALHELQRLKREWPVSSLILSVAIKPHSLPVMDAGAVSIAPNYARPSDKSRFDFAAKGGQLSIDVGWALAACIKRVATMPTIIDALQLGRQRYALTEAIVRLTESYRDDYLPGNSTLDIFALVLICQKMLAMHAVGREASASALARSTRIPRTTVLRKLAQLKKIGAIEQHGPRYLMSTAYLNRPAALQGFKRRVAILRKTAKKLSNLDTSSSSEH